MHKLTLGSVALLLLLPLAVVAGLDPTPATAAPQPSCTVRYVPDKWCAAVSRPARDSYYPGPGRPAVDALHYRLRLRWEPVRHRLVGKELVTFRAARTRPQLSLALTARMRVDAAWFDGRRVHAGQHGNDLVVHHGITAGSVYRVLLRYHGTPRRARPLAQQRNALGIYETPKGDLFTNDEPVGAHQWYAVNDQPSDKAFYDFRLTAPAPRVGVANGTLVSRHRSGSRVITRFHLDAPAASYLTTVEFGRYRMTRAGEVHGTPVRLWTPAGGSEPAVKALRRARYFPKALAYVESKLGRYPFDSLGLVVVPGYASGMENQTLVTVGNTDYDTARYTLVHEIAHQWYGDQVTPRDWRDVWMNEGMATLVQYAWYARRHHLDLAEIVASTARLARRSWRQYGAPGSYERSQFGNNNVYFPPMLMWDQLRRRVGDHAFWSMVRAWPQVHAGGNADRVDYLAWVQQRLGLDLTDFFDAWLTGPRMPKVHHGTAGRAAPRALVPHHRL